MKNISQEKVFGIRTILPPLPLQQEFARRVTAVEQLKSSRHYSAGIRSELGHMRR